ncbi:hypothetical protein HY492_01245 [Candidatus Woesearchaeota archaeon]|nr:hypothetical protein [Candidatus Woesearchaeota archaeon]
MKILVGCPTSQHKAYCLKEYTAGVKALQGTFDVLIVDNSDSDSYLAELKSAGLPAVKGPMPTKIKDRIVACRNVLRQKVLDEGYDYFFSLEQDVIPPPDALQKLLAAQKLIVGGVYTKHYRVMDGDNEVGTQERPLLWTSVHGKIAQWTMDALEPTRVQQVLFTGLGCLLIHRSVLENISFRWDVSRKGFDDVFFCTDAQKFGIFVDTSVRCPHLEMSWEGIEK